MGETARGTAAGLLPAALRLAAGTGDIRCGCSAASHAPPLACPCAAARAPGCGALERALAAR